MLPWKVCFYLPLESLIMPNDFILKIVFAKYFIKKKFYI